MPSAWVDYVKQFAAKKGISYGCALSDPEVKAGYAASKPAKVAKVPKAPKKSKKALKVDLAKMLSVPSFV
jgi:hypothetical protein